MKARYIITLWVVFIMSITACKNEDLVELNIDKNSPNEINLSFLLARAQLQLGSNNGQQIRSNLIYSSAFVQHNADIGGFPQGDKYTYNPGYSASLWETLYSEVVKELTYVVDNADPASNLYAISLAIRSYALHKLTDMYGDIPYEQAGRGLQGQELWFPSYNTQQEVYGFLVRDLRAARDILNAGGDALGVQDVIYGGVTDQWKRFINSLLLRIGMRMSSVDPATAKQVVEEAVTNGVFTSNDHEAYIDHTEGQSLNTNGTSHSLRQGETYADDLRPSRTFVNWMKDNNDPRLMIIVGGTGSFSDKDTWNTDPAVQRGLPNGFNNNTILADARNEGLITNDSDWSLDLYSFINPELFDLNDPYYLIRYAEVELMLAEAVLNGWNVEGTAQDHFEAAISASSASWERYGVDPVSAADMTTYITGLGFGSADASNQHRMIGEQYWAMTYLTSEESWANWRRTGFPVLTPVDFPGNVTGGTIPRRFRYPEREATINKDAYDVAVGRQGADLFTTRIWWDVP